MFDFKSSKEKKDTENRMQKFQAIFSMTLKLNKILKSWDPILFHSNAYLMFLNVNFLNSIQDAMLTMLDSTLHSNDHFKVY